MLSNLEIIGEEKFRGLPNSESILESEEFFDAITFLDEIGQACSPIT